MEGLRWWKCLGGGGIWQRWGSDSGPTPSGMALGGGGGQPSSTQPRGLLKCLWLQCAEDKAQISMKPPKARGGGTPDGFPSPPHPEGSLCSWSWNVSISFCTHRTYLGRECTQRCPWRTEEGPESGGLSLQGRRCPERGVLGGWSRSPNKEGN